MVSDQSMPHTNTISRHLIHYAFIGICIAGFLLSCFGFLFYRLLLKPLVFGLILFLTLPLVGRELLKTGNSSRMDHHSSRRDH